MTEPLTAVLIYLLGALAGLALGFALFHHHTPPRRKE